MARPTNANAAETKQKILLAAATLFAEQGKQTSMREVAGSAGVSLGTVHHYFGSKEGLYEACIDAMDAAFGELAVQLVATARSAGSIEAMVESAVRLAYRFARSHELAVRLTTRDAVDKGEMEPARRAMILPGLDQGAALLAQRTGGSPEELRLVIRSIAHLVVRYALTEPREIALLLGRDPEATDDAAAHTAIEAHLVFTARSLLAALKGSER